MSQNTNKKQSDTQFVCKLCDMIDKYPEIINWNQQGDKMIIFDMDEMQSSILPQYFRHSYFPSFIRQLNMYDFHKLYKENKLIAFQNQYFKKGNQQNFHFIQRRKKIKQQQMVTLEFERKNQAILSRLKLQPKIIPSLKNSIQSLLEYKYTAHENTKKLHQQLQSLHAQLKDCRSKKISEALKQIKNNLLEQMNEQIQLSKKIDSQLQTSFLTHKQNKPILANNQQINSPFYLPFLQSDAQITKNFIEFQHYASNRHSFIAMPSHCGFWSANDLHSYQPFFLSGHKIMSEADFSTNNKMKLQQPEFLQFEELSMERLKEGQLEQILKNQPEQKIPEKQIKENQNLTVKFEEQ